MCHPDEKITTQKANAIATTIKKRAGGQLLNTSPPPEILREAGRKSSILKFGVLFQ